MTPAVSPFAGHTSSVGAPVGISALAMSGKHPLCCLIRVGDHHTAAVDEQDFHRVSFFNWSVCYRRRSKYADTLLPSGKRVYLHRFILNAAEGVWIDHKDGNGLNCIRENLRICSPSQNRQNAPARKSNPTGFKGVRTRGPGSFIARICVNGKDLHLGTYRNPVDAAIAYDLAAIRFFGEFARTNVLL